MNHYLYFTTAFKVFQENAKIGNTIDVGSSGEKFAENIEHSLKECKVFEIEDTIKKLLLLTDPPNKNDDVPLPFDYIFVNVEFTKDELENVGIVVKEDVITGLLLSKGNLLHKGTEGAVGTALRLTIFRKEKDNVWFDTINSNINITDDNLKKNGVRVQHNVPKATSKFVRNFALNFINFVNNPEVKIIEVMRGEKNQQRRLREGKLPLPSSKMITLTGSLKEYVNQLMSGGHFHYSCKFWVRGHYRTLRNVKRYGENADKRMFIPPYLKGMGILINKKYKLEENNENGRTTEKE